MWQTILSILLPLLGTAVLGIIVSYLKKGQFKEWGIAVGKTISKFANLKIGKERWEKMEDSLVVAFVSFAMGVKEGADYDDVEIKTIMVNPEMVGKLKY